MTDIQLSPTPLEVQSCLDFVSDTAVGGIDVFVGTVRNQTKGKEVLKLEFEAYEPMALREMQKLADQAREKWDVLRIAIHHRTGTLGVGEIPVIIAVSAAHRTAAFDACRYIIDTLKETVPIWKKEYFAGGEVWVNAHP
ncbi:MAG TPA: molybdenum cofactor biosynthesis protein MoaE [Flavipsychrobacter sp.]|nr:molybdenum cofactor biosynthesis protein MoaE [Flavipsychrobacter sp.]